MSHKKFAERLNKTLDEIELPTQHDERVDSFAKLLKIPRFKADALLTGALWPDPQLLDLLINELEVAKDWLLGDDYH